MVQQLFPSLAEQGTVPQSQAADTQGYVGQLLPSSLPVFLVGWAQACGFGSWG